MSVRTLVVCATQSGSTREVAERIGADLQLQGVEVDFRAGDDVGDVACYDAVVLGSPVINGSWLPEMIQFVDVHHAALGSRPVWIFSMGTFGDTHLVLGSLMKKEPREIRGLLSELHPRDYRVFAGVIDRRRWSWVGGLVVWLFGGHFGDNRNWPDIDKWASGIARECLALGGEVEVVRRAS